MKRKKAPAKPSRKTPKKRLVAVSRRPARKPVKRRVVKVVRKPTKPSVSRHMRAALAAARFAGTLAGASETFVASLDRHASPRALVAGIAIVIAIMGTTVGVLRTVSAATYQGPSQAAPGGNIPVTVWNRAATTLQQTNAAMDIDGNGGTFKGIAVGNATLGIAAGQNLLYGNVDTASLGNLLLLQTESADRFRVSARGDVKGAGCFGATFVGVTPANYHGSLGAVGSYYAADNRCTLAFAGSHVCRPDEILESISCSQPGDPIRTIANGSMAWVNGGPPGHTSNGNDCNGWQSNASTYLGKFWVFNQTTGGTGTQTTCNAAGGLAFSCCR